MRSAIPSRGAWVLLGCLLAATAALAHPGVGIVEDGAGNIFYTDLSQVWRIAPDGTKSVAVPGVHTHELCLDAEDSLYGEHLWYEGDATKKWGYRVWKRTKVGVVKDIIPAREGFRDDYSFVRDRLGTMYWADRGAATVVKARAPDGTISVRSKGPFRDVRWMTATPDGVVYLVDTGRLLAVAKDGTVTTAVAVLSAKTPPPAAVTDPHYQGGLFVGPNGSVYVTVPEERLVLEVKSGGGTRVAARSPLFWAAYGGMIDRAGNLWLLETSSINAVRVRRIGKDGKERVF
jgi:sugar lactone lactonase YvrE